jgi:hypothetical protein
VVVAQWSSDTAIGGGSGGSGFFPGVFGRTTVKAENPASTSSGVCRWTENPSTTSVKDPMAQSMSMPERTFSGIRGLPKIAPGLIRIYCLGCGQFR